MAKHFAAWGRLMRDDMNRPTSVDVAIIGAGPAGLTAAYLLTKEGYRVTVIEKDPDYVGGISRTVEHEGFRFDIGGQRFFFKLPGVVELWTEILTSKGSVEGRGWLDSVETGGTPTNKKK